MMTYFLGIVRLVLGVVISVSAAALEIIMLPVQRKSGIVFHWIARCWARTIVLTCGLRVRVRGLEKLDFSRNYVYVSNHASMLDIPVILASVPDQIRIVYKKELEVLPVFGWGLKWGSYIGIDRGRGAKAMQSLEEAIARIRNGASVLLYAEGTRTTDGALQPFKRGAFNIAARAGTPIVPLTLNGTFPLLPRGSLIIRPGEVELVAGEPIPVEGVGKDAELRLMERVHRALISAYVNQGPAASRPADAPTKET